jgi:hypothetical protein
MATVAVAAPGEVVDLLYSAQNDKTDPGRRHDVGAMFAGGQFWKVEEGGAIVGAMLTHTHGEELWVDIAVGRAQEDLVALMAEHLDSQGAGFRSIGFQTARRGLVRKIARHGYEVEAYILRKNL